jgi:hypothetical protein
MRTKRSKSTKWARQVAMLHDFDRQNICSPTASTGLIYGPAASSKSIEPRFGGGSHSWHLHACLWICETSSTEPVAVSVFHLVSPVTNGIYVYALRIGKVPVCHPASVYLASGQ